jgi:hypothetical protein
LLSYQLKPFTTKSPERSGAGFPIHYHRDCFFAALIAMTEDAALIAIP